MKREQILSQITTYLSDEDVEFETVISDEYSKVVIPLTSAMSLHILIFNGGSVEIYGQVRTTSWHFDGERTDLHDFLAILWSICLRCCGMSSSTVVFEPNEFTMIEGEFYAGYVIIRQPSDLEFSRDSDLKWLREVITSSQKAAFIFFQLIKASRDEYGGFDTQFEGWGETDLSKQFSDFEFSNGSLPNLNEDESNAMTYKRCFWEYFQVFDAGVSVFRITNPYATAIMHGMLNTYIDNLKNVEYQNGEVVYSKNDNGKLIGNFIALADLKKLNAILDAASKHGGTKDLQIPIENYLIGLRVNTIVAVVADSGFQSFNRQRDTIRTRRSIETDFVLDNTSFQWKASVDSNVFEDFVLALIQKLPSVRWVRKVGEGNEPDHGRDLVAEWLLPPTPYQQVHKENPIIPRRIIIQCKAYERNVGKSSVTDVRDTIDFHKADGYLLVAYPGITRPLLDYLDAQRRRGIFWFDWWTKVEIEDLLRNNIDLVKRFPEVVSVTSL